MTKKLALFGRTKALESQIDAFLDRISESALSYRRAIQIYLSEGASTEFEEQLSQVNAFESEADGLRRNIELELYTETLIPDSRGDVLGLLENLDKVLNRFEGSLWGFSIETPDIPEQFHEDFGVLTDQVVNTVEALVHASRAFFRNIAAVGDHMHKVMFYEKEADRVSTKLKRTIFGGSLELAHKSHLRTFVEDMDAIADKAEDVADRLAIYTIKRTV